MKNLLSIVVILTGMFIGTIRAEEKKISSPDGKLSVTVTDDKGIPSYAVAYRGVSFIELSSLGLNTNIGDFTQQMTLTAVSPVMAIDEHYELSTIKRKQVHYQANKGVFTFSKDGKVVYDVIFQISNNDVAFRYKMYPQGDSLCCVINEEATGFILPEGTTTFLCPQSGPMGGFARTSPSYETPYTVDAPMGQNGWGEGYTFPCLFRRAEKGWILISETGVSSLYCGSVAVHQNEVSV